MKYLSMSDVTSMLRRAAAARPGDAELMAAARRAADDTNAVLSREQVPMRARVKITSRGARVELIATGKMTKGFSGRHPAELLRDNVNEQMHIAAENIRIQAKKMLDA